MRKPTLAALALLTLVPHAGHAKSAFDGTWKADLASFKLSEKSDIYRFEGKFFYCDSCVPVVGTSIDAVPHGVAGQPYFDATAIKIVDDHTIHETDYMAGRPVIETTYKVAADNKTLTIDFTDRSNRNGGAVSGQAVAVRVAPGAAGSHPLAGAWRTVKFTKYAANGITQSFTLSANRLSMSTPTGQSYSALLDGSDAPCLGNAGITAVSLKKLAKNKIEETAKLRGHTVGVVTMTVARNGKTMAISYDNKVLNRTVAYTLVKQ